MRGVLDRLSFRAKLMVMLGGLVLFAIVTVSAAFVMLQWQAMMDAEQTKHETLAGLTAENLAPALAFGDEQAVADTLRALLHEPDILKVTVSDPEHQAIQQVHRDMQDATSEGRKSLETFSVPVLLGEESLGELSVSVDMTPLRHELMQQLVWVGLMALAVLLLALLLALAMQRYLSGSVLALREGMRRVRDEGDLSTRIEERGQDELAELARGFNAMIRQIRRHEAELEDKVRERTERLQLELDARERLERNLERMFWALDQMGEAMLLLNRDGRVDYVNPSFARLTGRNLAELSLVEQPLVSAGVMSEAQAAEAFEWLQQHEIWSSDLRSHRADGSEYPSHLSLARLADENGEITHYVAVLRDVSEQERLAEELRQAQKMEAVGVLVGGIAHDFNNMLAALSGSIELARLDAQDPARVREWLGDMEVLAHRGAETVAKLLAFARKGPIQFRTGDLRALFEELQKMVRIGVPESIDVRFDLADGPMPVNMDANQIEQAMLNLINNAVDAVADSSRPEVRIILRAISASAAERGEDPASGASHAEILVQDNGVGMDERILSHVFEPFFTTKDVGKGTGLGLSMVYGSVQRHGGTVEVESRPGEGTSFRVCLPLVEDEAHALASAPMQPPQLEKGSGELILLTDDEEKVRQTASRLLKHLGYRVIEAADGEEAWRLFRKHEGEIALAILDLVMPVMGGVKAAGLIRASAPDFPLLFVSGYDLGSTAAELAGWRNISFLSKPYRLEELSRKIDKLLLSADR